jgi:heat shock protein HslJ
MVSGFAGCNKFSGPVTLGATELRLGSLVTTKMACERPAGTVESMYLEALAGATSWSIDATGQLVLGGAIPLTFGPG